MVADPPDDAVGPGVKVPIQTPPHVSSKFLFVRVSNSVSPSSFSLQLIGVDTTDALENLMAGMQ